MSIILEAAVYDRIIVSGDLTASLKMPLSGIEDRFWINLSEGSRILATPNASGQYGFQLVDEGAAIIHIDGNRIDVEWHVGWVALSGYYEAARGLPNDPAPLPLFDRIAA